MFSNESYSIYNKDSFKDNRGGKETRFENSRKINFSKDDISLIYPTLQKDFNLSDVRLDMDKDKREFWGFNESIEITIQLDNDKNIIIFRNKSDLRVIVKNNKNGKIVKDKIYIDFFN